jgi:hypothetical protein
MLSKVASKFILRRYIKVGTNMPDVEVTIGHVRLVDVGIQTHHLTVGS